MTVDEADIKADMHRAIQAWFEYPVETRPSAFVLGERLATIAAGAAKHLPDLPQPPAWQPIETFPRDGEHYLADDDRVDGGFPQVVYFDEETGRLRVPDADISYLPGFFTHWTVCPLASSLSRPEGNSHD